MVVAAPTAAPRPGADLSTADWDSRAVVIRDDDRSHLRARIADLIDAIEAGRSLPLADLAASLAADLVSGGARLGLVATSTTDLLTKLRRALERLNDEKCRQIRDAAGVYFFEQPLFTQGTLALLFPGEGAQYTGMLADLCPIFPEVEETFDWCDELAAASGRPSLREVLHPTPDRRPTAEAELRKLGPSIFGVLVADLAVTKLLNNLGLPIAAVAGHSAGELAALLASGAMNSQAVLGPRLAEIMDLMQRQEEEAGGPEVALLAIGAGKGVVDEIASGVAGGSVVVAMDNCPHQCVAVGRTIHIEAVESTLLARGIVCERLPFRRPYHTPLFEQWMGPFRELFEDVPFASPHTPVYCCSTGVPFPPDPDEIRRLAVNHWVNPVEFSRMIESMYADGMRLFVEAGPRGNLSAFVEDILRGKPFAAVPANVARRSGPTQVNHLVAQLAAHHVPLRLGHLFSDISRTPGDFNRAMTDHILERAPTASHGVQGHRPGQSPGVMVDYLAVMERFLDVQREVMEAYLAGRSAPGRIPLEVPGYPDHEGVEASRPRYALLERIEQFEPGVLVVYRHTMDEREDLFADDHTLGGRGVSRVDPGQNGLPVLPMTFSLEAMAEAAALLVPGKEVVAIRNVRLHRWLPFDPDPTTIEVRASVLTADLTTGMVEIKADVRDLGNSFQKDGKVASEATLVLADHYPDPPDPLPFVLTEEAPCKSTVEDLRRNMFHGPLFHMIRSLDRIGREGIEGTLEVQPRTRWFRSNPDPDIVLDPVLMDAAMHMLGAWHLEQPDWTGRILLPFEVQRIDFFGPAPPIGSRLIVRGHNEQESPRHYRHGLEVFDPEGRLWLRLTGAGYWRFYLPFGHVNFFGPKDQYFLSRNFAEAVPRRGENSPARRCHLLEPPVDLRQPVLRASGARVTMTPRELVQFRNWDGTDNELNDWFFGRMLAKDAVRAVWAEKHGEAMFPADIETELVEGRIICRPRGEPKAEPLPPVRTAIAGGVLAAISAFTDSIGMAMLVEVGAEGEARSRAARLAIADALGVQADGLTVEPTDRDGLLLVHHGGTRLRVQTARYKNVIVATTLCEAESS